MTLTPTWDIDLYARAWEFATLWHAGQTYGGANKDQQIPYINHLASVAAEVTWGLAATPGADANLAIQCALLHDTLEDTEAGFDRVAHDFGLPVAQGVLALTKDVSLASREAQMSDSLRRILLQPVEIAMVKLADRTANLYHPPFYWNAARIEVYRVEGQLILDTLGAANGALARRLAGKIASFGRGVKGA